MASSADRIAQLRDEISALRSMIDSALDTGANRRFLQAMVAVLRERTEELDWLGECSAGN